MSLSDIITAARIAKFDAALAGNGEHVLSPEAANAITTDATKIAVAIDALPKREANAYPITLLAVDASGTVLDPASLADKTPFAFQCRPGFPWDPAKHKLQFYVDGKAEALEANVPLASFGNPTSSTFNTRLFPAGKHSVYGIVYASGVKVAESPVTEVTVRSTAVTPPTTPTTPTVPPVAVDRDPALVLAEFLKRPKPFANQAAALAWDRAFFEKYTGPTDESKLQRVSSLTMTSGRSPTDRNVYRDKWISDDVDFSNLKYVDLINCVVDGGEYGVHNKRGPSTDCRVLNCRIYSTTAAGAYVEGVPGGEFILNFNKWHDGGADAVKARRHVKMFCNYWTDLGKAVGAHADGVQLAAGHHDVECILAFSDMPNDAAGTRSNAMAMLDGTSYNVVLKYIVVVGGNFAIQAHARNLHLDWVWYYVGSADFGLRTGGNADDTIGTNFFNAVTGAKIASNAK
jgi:hypothetical protein